MMIRIQNAINWMEKLEQREYDHAHDLDCPVVRFRYDHDEEEWKNGPHCNCEYGRVLSGLRGTMTTLENDLAEARDENRRLEAEIKRLRSDADSWVWLCEQTLGIKFFLGESYQSGIERIVKELQRHAIPRATVAAALAALRAQAEAGAEKWFGHHNEANIYQDFADSVSATIAKLGLEAAK